MTAIRLRTFLLAIALTTIALLPLHAHSERGPLQPAAASTEDPEGARVIVKYKALGTLMRAASATRSATSTTGTAARGGPRHAVSLAQRSGLALRDGHIIDRYTQVVHGAKGLSSAALAARLAADPEVEYAVPDLRRHILAVPNDTLYAANTNASPAIDAGQWYLRPVDATFLSAINAQGAWALTTGSSTVVVADIDTGVLYNHPDLAGKLLPGRNFVSANGNTGQGWSADASDPGDWSTNNECGSGQAARPSSWHGTQTSSLIGAQTNNGIGMASVGYNIKVLPVRVLSACGGYDSDIIAAMYWAAGLSDPNTGDPAVPANPTPARVINLSLGGAGTCNAAYATLVSQLTAHGVVVVAAAGNDEGLAVNTPGNCAGVIAVAGVRHAGTKVGFSSIGPQVAIAAPGGNCVNTSGPCLYPILTALNTGTTTPNTSAAGYSYSDTVNYAIGTSFSTPLVAGTAALMLSANPALSAAQVKSMLQSSARPFPTQPVGSTVPMCQAPTATAQDECYCTTSTCGAGMLDAAAAVRLAAVSAGPVAIVSAPASVPAGSTVTFDGSASTAPAGLSFSGFQWTLTSGSAIATLVSASNGTLRVNTIGIGSFTVRLTVTDSSGATASTDTTVSVVAPPPPSVKVVPSAPNVLAGNDVSFDSSGSTVASGLQKGNYQWAVTAGGQFVALAGANVTTAQFSTVPTAPSGSFTVQYTLFDSVGQSASTSVTVGITSTLPTVSVAAASNSVLSGASVAFDGSGSSAFTGRTISSYLWQVTSGNTIAKISGSASGPQASVVTSGPGSFTVQLTVTDSQGQSSTATSTVTVTAAPPSASILASTNTVVAGNSVSFDGSGSTTAPGVSVTAYQWTLTSGAGLASITSASNAATATVQTAGTASGSFTLQLTVTDSLGRSASTSSTVAIVAAAPTASISTAAANVTAGTSVAFDGSGSLAPSGRTISSYQWAITSGSAIAAISGSASGASVNVATSAAGSFTVQLTVTDNLGSQAVKTATVTVNAAPTPPSTPGGGGGGGGGGAMSLAWLLALAVAVLALTAAPRRSNAEPAGKR